MTGKAARPRASRLGATTATIVRVEIIRNAEAPWDVRCLDFHRQDRVVQTPSRWQVRQPICARSVGRWQAYARHLPDIDRAFAPLDHVIHTVDGSPKAIPCDRDLI